MSSVKLDPEKKFKWVEYRLATPLTETENTKLKSFLQSTYSGLIDVTLNNLRLRPCSGNITMITLYSSEGKTYINQPLFGTYKSTDVSTKLGQSTVSEDLKSKIQFQYNYYKSLLKLPANIEDIKKKFRECLSDNLFVVHLEVVPLEDIDIKQYTTHSNILVIAKNRGTVYWIEPQTTINPTYEKLMITSIKNLVAEIGMPDATIINPVEVCPQAVTQDRNCMFWTYVIFLLIMLNPQERDHNIIINRFMEKYPTKESLETYMNNFKRDLFSKANLSGGKRRRTYRKKRVTTRRR